MNSRMRLVPHSGSLGSVYEVYYELESYTVCVIAHTVYPPLASQFAERWSAAETAPPRPKSGIPEGIRARMHFASAKDSLLPSPPSPYLSFLLTLLLLSSRREFIGTTRDDVKLPFHARKRISHIISAPRAAFSTLFSDLRRHVDLIVAIIYERGNSGHAHQAPKSSGGCVNQPWVLSYR